jgi:hypothetical protein
MTDPTQTASKKLSSDEQLLAAAVRLLEYGTYHDNRYGQMGTDEWQSAACTVAKHINERLGRKRYAEIGHPEMKP